MTRGLAAPHHRKRLNKGVKEDLRVWLTFLEQHNGKCFFLNTKTRAAHEVELYTDASGALGYGAVFGSEWFFGKWSQWWTEQNITFLELYPIVLAVEVWGAQLANKRLMLHTDNEALVAVLAKQTSRETYAQFPKCHKLTQYARFC